MPLSSADRTQECEAVSVVHWLVYRTQEGSTETMRLACGVTPKPAGETLVATTDPSGVTCPPCVIEAENRLRRLDQEPRGIG